MFDIWIFMKDVRYMFCVRYCVPQTYTEKFVHFKKEA